MNTQNPLDNLRVKWDCIIIGGGLAGGLLLSALKFRQPQLDVLLIEQGSTLGGNKTWSFHEADIPNDCSWMRPLISNTWNSYDVIFPKYQRTLNSKYHSIKSTDFHDYLLKHFGNNILLNTRVVNSTAQEVSLENGQTLQASKVVNCSGWPPTSQQHFGYQKFVGLDIKTKKPHGLKNPILKDATIAQTDGYRFFYVLPWSENELLIEDTYYSNSDELDVDAIQQEILKYAQSHQWEIETVLRKESGCLRLPLEKKSNNEKNNPQILLGASSEIYQPVTGYTFPETILRVDLMSRWPLSEWSEQLAKLNRLQKPNQDYLLLLNRMLFLAADPEKRYQVLERFYTFSPSLIDRFYSGRLTTFDKIRVLVGKPPVSIWRAIKSLMTSPS